MAADEVAADEQGDRLRRAIAHLLVAALATQADPEPRSPGWVDAADCDDLTEGELDGRIERHPDDEDAGRALAELQETQGEIALSAAARALTFEVSDERFRRYSEWIGARVEHHDARRNRPLVRSRPRRRGAGRPRARAAGRSSARSGDSGDDAGDDPEPPARRRNVNDVVGHGAVR